MQNVVYADILILLNTVITFMILMTTSEFIRIESEKFRYLTGSFAGGVFSLIIFAPRMNIMLMLIARALICILIVLISFNVHKLYLILRCAVSFILISFLYSGIIYFILNLISSEKLYFNNGYFYFEISTFSIIFLSALVFILIRLFNKFILKKKKKELVYTIKIINGSKEVQLSAFFDTGNSIKDSFTGKPVVLVAVSVINDLLDDNDKLNVLRVLNENDYSLFTEKLRLIPVRSIGEYKLLPAFTVEKVIINNQFVNKIIKNPSIVICADSFEDKEYKALINKDILGEVI